MPAKPDAGRLSLNRARGRLNSTDAYLNGMNRQVKSPGGGEGGFIVITLCPKAYNFFRQAVQGTVQDVGGKACINNRLWWGKTTSIAVAGPLAMDEVTQDALLSPFRRS